MERNEPQAAQRGPNTHWFSDYRGTSYTLVQTTDVEGVVHTWELPTEVYNEAQEARIEVERERDELLKGLDDIQPLLRFGHTVGVILASDKEPKGNVVEGIARMLDELDDATDEYLAAKGSDHRVERTMQNDLRALTSTPDATTKEAP